MAVITGTPNDDVDATKLQGTSAADTIYGLAGGDEIVAGDANDTLIGGPGGDFLNGGAGVDTASYAGASDPEVWVSLSAGEVSESGDAAGDQFTSVENLTGSGHDDLLEGDLGANRLRGGNGNDGLFGAVGNDRLEGQAGNDGLYGGEGNDLMFGGGGRDEIIGSLGGDEMTGGAGADHFLFLSPDDSQVLAVRRDLITDFSKSQGDKVAFGLGGHDDLEFIGTAAFDGVDQVRFGHVDGNTRIAVNLDADSTAEQRRCDCRHPGGSPRAVDRTGSVARARTRPWRGDAAGRMDPLPEARSAPGARRCRPLRPFLRASCAWPPSRGALLRGPAEAQMLSDVGPGQLVQGAPTHILFPAICIEPGRRAFQPRPVAVVPRLWRLRSASREADLGAAGLC